jgi:uncharacterized protein YggU (UPF0235/DUF167 family)
MIELQTDPRGVILPVRAHAGARQTAVLGVRQGMLRVAVTEAPEKGKANKAIAAVLSKALGVPKSSLELVSGATSAQKRFLVLGGDADQLRATLERIADQQ